MFVMVSCLSGETLPQPHMVDATHAVIVRQGECVCRVFSRLKTFKSWVQFGATCPLVALEPYFLRWIQGQNVLRYWIYNMLCWIKKKRLQVCMKTWYKNLMLLLACFRNQTKIQRSDEITKWRVNLKYSSAICSFLSVFPIFLSK